MQVYLTQRVVIDLNVNKTRCICLSRPISFERRTAPSFCETLKIHESQTNIDLELSKQTPPMSSCWRLVDFISAVCIQRHSQ